MLEVRDVAKSSINRGCVRVSHSVFVMQVDSLSAVRQASSPLNHRARHAWGAAAAQRE